MADGIKCIVYGGRLYIPTTDGSGGGKRPVNADDGGAFEAWKAAKFSASLPDGEYLAVEEGETWKLVPA